MIKVRVEQNASPQLNGIWTSGGVTVNPIANDVIVSTGALDAGDYLFQIMLNASVASRFIIEHRNAADSATLDSIEVPLGIDQFIQPIFGNKISLAQSERIRVIIKTGVTGNVQGSIFSSKIVA